SAFLQLPEKVMKIALTNSPRLRSAISACIKRQEFLVLPASSTFRVIPANPGNTFPPVLRRGCLPAPPSVLCHMKLWSAIRWLSFHPAYGGHRMHHCI